MRPRSPTRRTSMSTNCWQPRSPARPKGVLVEHRNLLNTMRATQATFDFNSHDVVPWIAPFAFDIALFELLTPLLVGGSVMILTAQQALDLHTFADLLLRITFLHAVPGLMRSIIHYIQEHGLQKRYAQLRTLFVGGDMIPPDLVAGMQAVFPTAK